VCPGHIHTALFATLNAPSQFFFPTLHPIEVVKRVIKALDETHSQTIYLPFYAHFMPALQLLPDFVADFSSWVRVFASLSYALRGLHLCVAVERGLCHEGLCQDVWPAARGRPRTSGAQ
jgi:hypothetical protein